jgi:hypothetical protein
MTGVLLIRENRGTEGHRGKTMGGRGREWSDALQARNGKDRQEQGKQEEVGNGSFPRAFTEDVAC